MPEMLSVFMYALMKEASRNSLVDFLEDWEISQEELKKIEEWFFETHRIKL